MTFLDDNTKQEEPNNEDFQIARGALDTYVRHNRLGKLCICTGCVDMRNTYAQVMQVCRKQEEVAKEGEEWKKDAEADL